MTVAAMPDTPVIAEATRGRHTLFRGVRVFDGREVSAADSVRVVDDRIVEVGRSLSAPSEALVVAGEDRTLLPGLIDGHLHIVAREALSHLLAFGVTTVFDMYMDVDLLAALRQEPATTAGSPRADFYSAGPLVTAPGGHGTEYNLPVAAIEGPAEAEALIDELIAAGADYIKIVYDDGAQYGLSFPTITTETMVALVTAAHARGRMVVAHVGTLAGARAAIAAQVDGLAHVFLDRMPDPGFGELAARHRVFVSPTLSSLLSVTGVAPGAELADDPAVVPWLSERSRMNLRHAYPAPTGVSISYAVAEEAVRQLQAAGVRLLVGSDVPNPGTAYGATTHGELELLVRAGLRPIDALRAATSTPADLLHLDDRGRIAPGKTADLLLVEGDPTQDIAATRSIVGVWKRGVTIDRDALRAPASAGARPSSAPLAGSLLVSDFDAGAATSEFGCGWATSTDRIIGGASVATFDVCPGGAQGTPWCLEISGEIRDGAPFAWAGAVFFPGAAPLAPADLSRARAITFWARGDGRRSRVILFSKALGMVPIIQSFDPPRDWTQFHFPLRSFSGMDGHDLTGVLFSGGPERGPFRFWIDDVRFE